jgi:hypothetical protein
VPDFWNSLVYGHSVTAAGPGFRVCLFRSCPPPVWLITVLPQRRSGGIDVLSVNEWSACWISIEISTWSCASTLQSHHPAKRRHCRQATANQPLAIHALFRATAGGPPPQTGACRRRSRPECSSGSVRGIVSRSSSDTAAVTGVDRARTPPDWFNRWCRVVVELQPGDCLFQVNDLLFSEP